MFNDINENVAVEENRLGGGFSVRPSGAYKGKIKMAYGDAYASGSKYVKLIVELEDGSEYSENLLITGKEGKNYYVKDGVERGLMGYTVMNDLCLLTVSEGLKDVHGEEKSVLAWDNDLKKEVPQPKYVLTPLIGKDILFTLRNVRKNKNKKNEATGKWDIVTNDEDISNEIHTVFHTETGLSATELRNQVEEPVFFGQWVEKYTDHVFDSYKEVSESKSGGAFGASKSAGAGKPKGNPFAKKA